MLDWASLGICFIPKRFLCSASKAHLKHESLWKSLQRDHRHHDLELLARGPLETRRFSDWTMAFSSYPSLNRFNMPGFFSVDKEGMSAEAERCAQADA
jgi:hypothetical protein